MRITHISDTHGKHHLLKNLPGGDVIVHCGDFTEDGTEEEVLDFLNWFIDLPYRHKIFVTGNHDICLRDAEGIEDLPENVHFLQDRGIVIDRVSFYGLAFNHPESNIPDSVDVLVTHEPPLAILDGIEGTNWGNLPLLNRIYDVKPKFHLFGHTHGDYGIIKQDGIIFSNAALLDEKLNLIFTPQTIIL